MKLYHVTILVLFFVLGLPSLYASEQLIEDAIAVSNKPDVHVRIKRDLKDWSKCSNSVFPVYEDVMQQDYIGLQELMVVYLSDQMNSLVDEFTACRSNADNILREASSTGSLGYDINLESYVAGPCQKANLLVFFDSNKIDYNLFESRVRKIIPRFKERGFDMTIEIVSSNNS